MQTITIKLTCNEQNNCTSNAARWWSASLEERAQFTDYMAHDYRSSKHREIGCEVRKKGPSKTTPKHSLNLCNGYAAGNWANLPCKESPFCTQHFKGERNRVSGSQWAQGEGGVNSRCTFVSRSDRNWQGVFKMRDLADLGQSSSSVNTTVLPQSSKTEENHNTVRRNAEKVKM